MTQPTFIEAASSELRSLAFRLAAEPGLEDLVIRFALGGFSPAHVMDVMGRVTRDPDDAAPVDLSDLTPDPDDIYDAMALTVPGPPAGLRFPKIVIIDLLCARHGLDLTPEADALDQAHQFQPAFSTLGDPECDGPALATLSDHLAVTLIHESAHHLDDGDHSHAWAGHVRRLRAMAGLTADEIRQRAGLAVA